MPDSIPKSDVTLKRLKKVKRASKESNHPSIRQEVYGIIKQLKNNKAKKTNDLESKYFETRNPVISYYLSELFNLSVNTGV